MTPNKYVQPFNEAAAVETGVPNYTAQVLSDDVTGLFMGIFLEEGGCGPGLHYHHCDQLYFLTRGSVQIRFGDDIHDVATRSLIYIPAGVPHCNWNSGKGLEAHLEMQFPSPHRFRLLGYQVDAPDKVPDEYKTTRQAYIRQVDDVIANGIKTQSGVKIVPLADPSSGSKNVQVYYAEAKEQSAPRPTRIHEFDMYFFVVEGEMRLEIAMQKQDAKTETLVKIPAGVPYSQYNAGKSELKYLGLLVPPPGPSMAIDIGVELSASDAKSSQTLPQVNDVE